MQVVPQKERGAHNEAKHIPYSAGKKKQQKEKGDREAYIDASIETNIKSTIMNAIIKRAYNVPKTILPIQAPADTLGHIPIG